MTARLPLDRGANSDSRQRRSGQFAGMAEQRRWISYTVDYLTFNRIGAATSGYANLFVLPRRTIVWSSVIIPTVQWVGGAMTSLKLSVGIPTSLGKYSGTFEVMAVAPSPTNFQVYTSPEMENLVEDKQLVCAAFAIGANLDRLTAGAAEVWILTGDLRRGF